MPMATVIKIPSVDTDLKYGDQNSLLGVLIEADTYADTRKAVPARRKEGRKFYYPTVLRYRTTPTLCRYGQAPS